MHDRNVLQQTQEITWFTDQRDMQWDEWLAALKGHPLQSALWGNAKCRVEGVMEHRFVALLDGEPVCMARVEERKLPLFGKAAWIGKGPTYGNDVNVEFLHVQLLELLRKSGFLMVFENPYKLEHIATGWQYCGQHTKTLILNLERDVTKIWSTFPSKLRNKIRSAERKGVMVEQTNDPRHIADFYRICMKISHGKGFELPGSEQLMQILLTNQPDKPFSAKLFAAFVEGRLVAGYLVICSGSSMHNIWSGYDRDYGINGATESIVWHLIRWSVEQKIKYYDQEGIDPLGNPSTYSFKKKFGGVVTELPGLIAFPLSRTGKFILMVGRMFNKI